MKRFLLSVLVFGFALPIFAQNFGTDVTIDDFGNRRKLELATAPNGWIYAMSSNLDPSGFYVNWKIHRSTDGGQTWTAFVLSGDVNKNIIDFDLTVTGQTASTLIVQVAIVFNDLVVGDYVVYVQRITGDAGTLIDLPYFTSTGTDPIRSVAIASTNELTPVGSAVPVVQLAYAYSATLDDFIIAVRSDDEGANFLAPQTVTAASFYIHNIDLDYGRGATSNWARFYLTYDAFGGLSSNYGSIYLAHEIGSAAAATWNTPVLVSSAIGVEGNCKNPRIAVQRATTDNTSGSNTVMICAELSDAAISFRDILGFVNSTPHNSATWSQQTIEGTAADCFSPDVEYDMVNQRFISTYFNYTNPAINALAISRNLLPTDNWTVVSSSACNASTNLIAPEHRIAFVPIFNAIGLCWIQEGAGGNGKIMYDQQQAGAGLESTMLSNIRVYPNPVQNQLFIEFDAAIEIQSARIVSMNGQEIRAFTKNEIAQHVVNVEGIPSGVYIVRIETSKGSFSQRFTKE